MAAQPTIKPSQPPSIDIARAPAPLFDDPIFHGATDPFVIWNPVKSEWLMYYTQRRATLANPIGFDWVHGTAIGIAASKDGLDWKYIGTCQGDHDLSDPLKGEGHGHEPGVTFWAPCFVYEANSFHMFVTQVDGIYSTWIGKRHILHYTSQDGINWKYLNTCQLNSERVIDATVYKVDGQWYMVYKDEAHGSHTFCSKSKDMVDWENHFQADQDGSQEGPFVFRWNNAWWLIVDDIPDKGLRIYESPNGINQWVYNNTILASNDGVRAKDNNIGHHPGIVVQLTPGGSEQCLVFYFTHQGKHSVVQIAELELGADGKAFCNRNKYLPATRPAG